VHDIVDFEGRGVPGVFVASDEFADAAETQSRALGFRPRWVLVPHPIQDRTDDEMRALADSVVDTVVDALLSTPSSP
jgi:alkanesulfonate monooxygenase SsuD/methylene tetrahydromethanopterin reductase-like flavin-dependent oxidoreductase (luciferase family)